MSKPIIRILQPGDEKVLETFLLSCVESSMFLLGNMRASGLIHNGQAYSGTYAAAFEDEQVTGVVAHYWNQNLVFQAPVHLVDPLWRAVVEASQRPVGGLIGPNDQVNAAKETLDIAEAAIQLDEIEKLYRLRLEALLLPDGLRSGRVKGRRIEPGDVALMTQWRVAYAIEAIGEKDGPQLWEHSRASVERSLEEGHMWVLEDQGEPVASSAFNTAIEEAVQIGGVWTPPDLRRRGYGRSVVAASLLDARLEGVEQAILFTGQSNIAAQKAYTALGFEHIDDYRLVLYHGMVMA